MGSNGAAVLVVVPWFSTAEWIETYEAAFSSDVSRWKDAKDTMLVWQARVEKLPAGIDVTLPLLQAKIIEMDPSVEAAVKSIFLASALQRFVTAIVKLPQTKYYRAKSIHHLALEIGLPMHLVDLRNEIVHGHGGWGGGESVHKGLEVSYKWIKWFYWDAEFQKMQNRNSVFTINPERWQNFLCLLRKFAVLAMSSAKKKIPAFIKVKESLIENLEAMYSLEPEECAKAVVEHVLLPDSSDLTSQLVNGEVCQCGCCISARGLARMAPLLACFFTFEKGVELLLSSLIKKWQEHTKLSSEWICIISGTLLDIRCFCSQEQHCADHSVMLEDPAASVNWRRVVTELLETQAQWASDIASWIMCSPKAGLTDRQKKRIMSLICLFHERSKACRAEESKTCDQIDYYTVDDILTAAKDFPLRFRKKLEKLRVSSVGPISDSMSVDSTVGVMAHQSDNSLFYKEMILRYPDSSDVTPPPSKRCKL